MAMLDSFFSKGFKAAKCKTLLKLTIPRIKLLRNRREIQLKQMRRDIAKLLETGQEATARIRVEHIIREEKMMAAQEIVELFCELIAVRLPIIETQRECPLDLKEAISSMCFAAPRCADLPELQQVQMLFAAKYGKEFVAAATELMPECGVNRQLVELLSVRAPDPEVKLKLLKDIAEEHELDWDPSASETELLKSHEDLLNGPTQFVSGSKLPLPEEKHDDSVYAASKQSPNEQLDSDDGFEAMEFPEVPKVSVRPKVGAVSASEKPPFPEVEFKSTNDDDTNATAGHEPVIVPYKVLEETSSVPKQSEPEMVPHNELEEISSVEKQSDSAKFSPCLDEDSKITKQSEPDMVRHNELEEISSVEKPSDSAKFFPYLDEDSKQFVPFVAPPLSSTTFPVRENEIPHSQPLPRTKSEVNVDLQDVLAAAQVAAESAERAAAAARSAASLAQVRIGELVKKRSDEILDISNDNPFLLDSYKPTTIDKPQVLHNSSGENIVDVAEFSSPHQDQTVPFPAQLSPLPSFDDHKGEFDSSFPSYYDHKVEFDSSQVRNDFVELNIDPHQPQRLPSMDDEYLSYPNLFKQQVSNNEHSTTSS